MGELWYNNEEDVPISGDNLLSRSKLFRSKLVTKYGYSPPFSTQQPENVVHFTWQEDIEKWNRLNLKTLHILMTCFWER